MLPVRDGEVVPVVMSARVGIDPHEQVELRIAALHCCIQVASLKIRVEDQERGFYGEYLGESRPAGEELVEFLIDGIWIFVSPVFMQYV